MVGEVAVVKVSFESDESGKDSSPGPIGVAEVGPVIVVLACASEEDARVDSG